ncbi:hypothetical protein CYMTET_32306, partial [Cymbomonas tetramitiformis]
NRVRTKHRLPVPGFKPQRPAEVLIMPTSLNPHALQDVSCFIATRASTRRMLHLVATMALISYGHFAPLSAAAELSSRTLNITDAFVHSSAIARAEAQFQAACGTSPHAICGGAADQLAQFSRLYRDPAQERVFVLDWQSLTIRRRSNGLGNTLVGYVKMLAVGMAAGRATFCKVDPCQNATEFEEENAQPNSNHFQECQIDPSNYFQGRGPFDWQWRGEVEDALRAAGAVENVFVSVDKDSFVSERDGMRVNGTMLDLLKHPAVKSMAWVRVKIDNMIPINGGMQDAVIANRMMLPM